uniref:hypothetical protein n=1 Tax=Streptomyces scabiei TaxID=1930 RepID=UPI0019695F36
MMIQPTGPIATSHEAAIVAAHATARAAIIRNVAADVIPARTTAATHVADAAKAEPSQAAAVRAADTVAATAIRTNAATRTTDPDHLWSVTEHL